MEYPAYMWEGVLGPENSRNLQPLATSFAEIAHDHPGVVGAKQQQPTEEFEHLNPM